MPDSSAVLEESEGFTSTALSAPGEYLAAKRKQKKFSEKKTADALKITLAKLQAVEASDFSSFPSETFIKGYLRNYARFLSVPEQEVMQVYSAWSCGGDYVDTTTGTMVPVGFQTGGSLEAEPLEGKVNAKPGRWWLVYLVMFLLVCVWGVSNFWLEKGVSVEPAQGQLETLKDQPDALADIEPPVVSGGQPVEQAPEDEGQPLLVPVVSAENEAPVIPEVDVAPVSPGLDPDISAQDSELDSVSDGSELNGSLPDAVGQTPLGTATEPEERLELLASRVTADKLVQSSGSFGLPGPGIENSLPPFESETQPEPQTQSEPQIQLEPEVQQASVQPLANYQDQLSFNFANECWVEVVDDTGSIIFSGLNRPGSTLDISGKPPFRVVIGQVQGTRLSLNGEPVLLKAPASGRVLRLQVGS